MTQPTTLDELNARFHQNHKIEGFGIGNIHITVPCPFCAAVPFAKHELMEMEEVLSKPHTCAECGRSAKLIFTHTNNSTAFEVVQTGGDDPPSFLPPIRRIEDEA